MGWRPVDRRPRELRSKHRFNKKSKIKRFLIPSGRGHDTLEDGEGLLQPLAAFSWRRSRGKVVSAMQKFFDKWFLPVVFVLICGVIGWALWRG
jgi:hypothetical protein